MGWRGVYCSVLHVFGGPMRTAEEVAEELCEWWFDFNIKDPRIKTQIIHELTAFSDERVRGAEKEWNQVRSCTDCRAEALEEAIDVIGNWKVWTPDHIDGLIETIRALKDKP
jgi:hypothetical protein